MKRLRRIAHIGVIGLICGTGTAAAETKAKTAQECYKQDHYWTVACSNLEGPQKLRDDCYAAGDTRLERCLDSVGKSSDIGPAGPGLPSTRVIERAPLHTLERGVRQ
jgi:hypothetical protein